MQAMIRPIHAGTKLHDTCLWIGLRDEIPDKGGARRLQPDGLPDPRDTHVLTALRLDRLFASGLGLARIIVDTQH
jgi:hypothetical protein